MREKRGQRTPARPRNPRGAGERLREELISAATGIIDETGDATQLTLRGVARRVGITAPSVYRHFADVDELRLAVTERAFAAFATARDSAGDGVSDPAQRLLLRCHAYCQFALDHPGEYRFLFRPQAPDPEGQRPLPGAPALAVLAESIRACQDAGLADADDPQVLATQVWAALHGLVLLRMNLPHLPWPAPLYEMADRSVAALINLRPSASAGESTEGNA